MQNVKETEIVKSFYRFPNVFLKYDQRIKWQKRNANLQEQDFFTTYFWNMVKSCKITY